MRVAVVNRGWPRMRSARAIHWLTALGLAVATGMLTLGGTILLDSRADTWQQAEHASNNLVLALARDITRNIMMYDLSIMGAREALARPDLDQVSPETRQMTLFDRAASAEYLGSMFVLNSDGDIIANSSSIEPQDFNLADREYFIRQKEQADTGLFVSRAFRSRFRGQDLGIALSRRITNPDGSFGGVVAGILRIAYFDNLFGKLDLGSAGSVTLFRSDGRIISRLPFREVDVDRDLSGTPAFRRYQEAKSGTVVGKATLDGVERLYSFRHLDNLPLILSVAVSVDGVYAAWWRKAVGIGSVLFLLCAATVALCLLFRREILRRMHAEQGLRDAAEQLRVIASTDGLTGLANRRTFDEVLSREWLRSIRSQTSVALVMLDADFFKRYNDCYGHPEGDQVLRTLAGCLAGNALRPGDLAARYGGEEFVILLPENELAGALVVAERIRAAVSDLRIPHAEHPGGYVTVSLGVAVARPVLGEPCASIVADADAALYDAKHAGRDRVGIAGLGDLPPVDWQLADVTSP